MHARHHYHYIDAMETRLLLITGNASLFLATRIFHDAYFAISEVDAI